ncbi:carbohydrate kinase family protein [Salinirubellus sp. GCM10025818]|uniref:carbohydrate kinase family protein n=1 Tax=Salinirubellus TaxID=2162630 RepID=UPI0030CD4569
MRVVCAGHVNWDVTLRVDSLPTPDSESVVTDRRESGGGSAANVAAALANLDVDASLVGSVGTDEHGELARRELVAAGVDTDPIQTVEGRTAVKYLLVGEGGEVAVVDDGGVNESFRVDALPPDLFDGGAVCHLTSQRPDTAARLAELASEAGLVVSFDPGRRFGERDYGATLELTDVLFVNDREADHAPALPADCRVVRTHGADGATLEGPDLVFEHPGYDLESVDTTGAGDAFAAGFHAARLRGADTERALASANACGAIAATVTGPRPDLSWERVSELVDG